MTNIISSRGFGYLRPRAGIKTATVSFTDRDTNHDLVVAPSDESIFVTEIVYSNGGAAMTKISLRYDEVTTDYIPFYCAANGGGLALNLLQSETLFGVLGSTLKVRQSGPGGANAVTVTVWYFTSS